MSNETREASVEFPCGCPASRNGCDHWQRRVPAAEPAQQDAALKEARRALNALRLEVSESVARDVSAKVEAAFSVLSRPAREPDADTRRLDWLEGWMQDGHFQLDMMDLCYGRESVRQAIDAARHSGEVSDG